MKIASILARAGAAKALAPSLLGALALLAPAAPARAAGTVTVCADGTGAGTLRAALAGGGTVTFALPSCTLTLVGPINITANTTINSGSHILRIGIFAVPINNFITLSGGGAVQIFNVAPVASLTLNNLTLSNGSAPEGGAILNLGGLHANNTSFVSNSAIQGGAIDNENGAAAYIVGGTFTGNTAGSGGAILNNSGVVNVSGSTFEKNVANIFNGFVIANGGGIANVGSAATARLTISNSTFDSNDATGAGGGIYNTVSPTAAPGAGAQATVETTTFSGNLAMMAGGGIASYQGGSGTPNVTLSVTNSTFALNEINPSGLFPPVFARTAIDTGYSPTTLPTPAQVTFSTFYDITDQPLIGGALVTVRNSIIDNPAGFTCDLEVIDGGYNLTSDPINACGVTSAVGSRFNVNPLLVQNAQGEALLASNGGPTKTIGLQPVPPATTPVSPAINAIPFAQNGCGVAPTNVDQRGVPRPLSDSGNCDIGAVQHLFVTTPPSGIACNGTYNKTFTGDVTVLKGQSCVFIGGGITGNVQVTPGGYFGLRYATADGDVEVGNAAGVAIGPDATIAGSLEVHGLSGDAVQDAVCGSQVDGNLYVHNNDAAMAIGSTEPSVCLGNTVGGNLDVHNNSAATTVDGNAVTGNLTDQNNSGPTEVFDDTVTGNLQCHNNTAITGGQDVAAQLQGQCAGF